MSGADVKEGKPAEGFGRMNRALDFVKEEGRWTVWREAAEEEDLAAALVAQTEDIHLTFPVYLCLLMARTLCNNFRAVGDFGLAATSARSSRSASSSSPACA